MLKSLDDLVSDITERYPQLDNLRVQLMTSTSTLTIGLSCRHDHYDPVSVVYKWHHHTWNEVGKQCHHCGLVSSLIDRDVCSDCGGSPVKHDIKLDELED